MSDVLQFAKQVAEKEKQLHRDQQRKNLRIKKAFEDAAYKKLRDRIQKYGYDSLGWQEVHLFNELKKQALEDEKEVQFLTQKVIEVYNGLRADLKLPPIKITPSPEGLVELLESANELKEDLGRKQRPKGKWSPIEEPPVEEEVEEIETKGYTKTMGELIRDLHREGHTFRKDCPLCKGHTC